MWDTALRACLSSNWKFVYFEHLLTLPTPSLWEPPIYSLFLWGQLYYLFFKLNILWWHWLIKLYRFQVYNSIIHHLYIILYVHHPKSSLLPSPFNSNLFTLFCFPPPPFTSGNHYTVVCVYKFCFLFLFNSYTFVTHSPNSPLLWWLSVCSLLLFCLWVYFVY